MCLDCGSLPDWLVRPAALGGGVPGVSAETGMLTLTDSDTRVLLYAGVTLAMCPRRASHAAAAKRNQFNSVSECSISVTWDSGTCVRAARRVQATAVGERRACRRGRETCLCAPCG
eukprot:4987816-Prymnesium_polylepis.2